MRLRPLALHDKLWLGRFLADPQATGMLVGAQSLHAGQAMSLAARILRNGGVVAAPVGDESDPVGCAWLSAASLAFFVIPAGRGRGLGAALAAAAVREGFERRLPVIEARVRYDNAPSLSVLHRLGFVRIGGSAVLDLRLTATRFAARVATDETALAGCNTPDSCGFMMFSKDPS